MQDKLKAWFCPGCGAVSDMRVECCPDREYAEEVTKHFAFICQQMYIRGNSLPLSEQEALSYKEGYYELLLKKVQLENEIDDLIAGQRDSEQKYDKRQI